MIPAYCEALLQVQTSAAPGEYIFENSMSNDCVVARMLVGVQDDQSACLMVLNTARRDVQGQPICK